MFALLEGALNVGTDSSSSSLVTLLGTFAFLEISATSFNLAFLLSALSSLDKLGEAEVCATPLPLGKLTPLCMDRRWGMSGAAISLGREFGRGATWFLKDALFFSAWVGVRLGRPVEDVEEVEDGAVVVISDMR